MPSKEIPATKLPLTLELNERGQAQVEALTGLQKELWGTIERSNREWLARIEAERSLASELAAKLASARSMPDAATAYQEWVARRMELVMQDNRKILADMQAFMSSASQLLNWPTRSNRSPGQDR